ncbi:DUF5685 family protein [Nocardia stercoris]|uniref:Regulatory protein n=1 Tax=Nocardia stercoris TaxID=2483361 RepID=A0A3M2L8N0_9NOCA|nr:DUF5685 family protein [Nocardia stercoris]RMI33927.1 hypothetical protein EBN03_05520 [Nocardia stercoris]
MFGIIRPCRHRLGEELGAAWLAQLCGLCLALRDDHGQSARIATNYDGLVISALVDAQAAGGATTRAAGPCPLRGMRRADVATGDSVRLAATVSLVLAAAKVRDHVADGDGMAGTAGIRPAARRIAQRWARQGTDAGAELGFDTAVLLEAVERQTVVEATAGPDTRLLDLTEPTETATAAAFGHTAILAGRPGNAAALTEIGRMFGRVAHLLDAAEDYVDDAAQGKWNPLAVTATPAPEAYRLCTDAVLAIELSLADVEFTDRRLIEKLLVQELGRAVRRTFRQSGRSHRHRATVEIPRDARELLAPPTRGTLHGRRRRGYPQPPPGYGYPPPGYGYPPPQYYGRPPRRRGGFCLPFCEGFACAECCNCGENCCCCSCECCGEGCCETCCD